MPSLFLVHLPNTVLDSVLPLQALPARPVCGDTCALELLLHHFYQPAGNSRPAVRQLAGLLCQRRSPVRARSVRLLDEERPIYWQEQTDKYGQQRRVPNQARETGTPCSLIRFWPLACATTLRGSVVQLKLIAHLQILTLPTILTLMRVASIPVLIGGKLLVGNTYRTLNTRLLSLP